MNSIISYNNQVQNKTVTPALMADFIEFMKDKAPKTLRTYTVNLRAFVAWMKYNNITQPERNDIIDFMKWLKTEHAAIIFDPETEAGWRYRYDSTGMPVKIACKDATVKLYMQSVKQFFKWADSRGYYENIAKDLQTVKVEKSHKKDALSVEEVQNIEKAINAQGAENAQAKEQKARLKAMFLLTVNAGLRTVEISRANVGDIEVKGNNAFLYVYGKGRTEANQKKAIAPEVYEAIKEYLECRTDKITNKTPLFTATGNRSGGKRLATTTISTMLKKAMIAAGYDSDRLTAHSLRHTTAAAVMEMTNNNIYITQKYLRHANPATTEIYLENENVKKDTQTAKQLFNHFHGTDDSRNTDKLQSIINSMTAEQLQQLTGIAEAIAK